MIWAKYPNIDNQRTSVLFAVKGLQPRHSLAPHVPMLLMQRLQSFRDLESAIDLLTTLEPVRRRKPKPAPMWDMPTTRPTHEMD